MSLCQADLRSPSFLCASARVEAGDEEVLELELTGGDVNSPLWVFWTNRQRDVAKEGSGGGGRGLTYSSQRS